MIFSTAGSRCPVCPVRPVLSYCSKMSPAEVRMFREAMAAYVEVMRASRLMYEGEPRGILKATLKCFIVFFHISLISWWSGGKGVSCLSLSSSRDQGFPAPSEDPHYNLLMASSTPTTKTTKWQHLLLKQRVMCACSSGD